MKKYPIPRLMLDSYLHPADNISNGYCLIPMPEDCPLNDLIRNACTITDTECLGCFPDDCPLEDYK